MSIKDFEMVIGLEVHCELKTETKIFCSCSTKFGAQPNTQVCPVCLGMPGSLPVLNETVVEYALKAGIATDCDINAFSKQDRKNYFYPDLPKAYQISQFDLPLCYGGHLEIETSEGAKRIGITRIHIEEDAGKLVHSDTGSTMIDCNRCGVPLIEIVSEPDMRSAEEAVAYFKKLRAVLLYTGISDCKMNEGSLRCDVNLSVRRKGEETLGTRTEMKNLNSFTFVQKAIEYEFRRQVEEVENGGKIVQETRRYEQSSGKTFSMRTKEDADEYRYFPDPDLMPVVSSEEKLSTIKSSIQTLPDVRKAKYIKDYALTPYDAELITNDPELANYFEKAVSGTEHRKIVANLLISELFKLVGEDENVPAMKASTLGDIAQLLGEGYINSSVGKRLIKDLYENDTDAKSYVDANNLAQISDREILSAYVSEVLDASQKLVSDYRAGKTNAFKALVGQVMAKTAGKGNPVIINELLEQGMQ